MFKLKNLTIAARGLTQNYISGYKEDHLPIGGRQAPMIFTRTLMASMTGDYLFEVGAGTLDSVRHTRLLAQYAAEMRVPVAAVADQYLQLLSSLGYSQAAFRQIVAGIIGPNDKPARYNSVAAVTPTYVHRLVLQALPEDTPEIMGHMVSDYVCHMLRPFGWVVKDAPYVYRIRRSGLFPRYQELVDVVVAKDLQRSIQVLADADLAVVKNAMEKKTSIMPAMIAQHLSNAVVTAYEISRSTYDPEAIVRSVLTTVLRVTLPDVPAAVAPRDRVRNHPVISELRSNLAIFMAAQEMAASGARMEVSYTDEEMTAVVLPLFAQAIAEVSPYAVRMLDDVINHVGKQSTRTHMGVPGHIFLYENWDFSTDVAAFVRVRQTATGPQSFLHPQTPVATALSSALKPVKQALSVPDLVERRVSMYELTAASARVPADGTEVVLGFPSIVEFEIEHALPVATVEPALMVGDENVELITPAGPGKFGLARLRFDYVALLTHLAVARTHQTSVAYVDATFGLIPYLQWTVKTDIREPIGESAIVLGEVHTAEPLEALAYLDDFRPTTTREGRIPPVDEFNHAVHLWNWYDASEQFGGFKPTYPVTLRNQQYVADVDEHEMLGLGVRRRQVRFIKPAVARAVARLWCNWILEDRAYLEAAIRSSNDSLMSEAYRGRQIQNAMQLVALLTRIGATGAGANAARFVTQRIAEQMYKSGNVDDYSQLHVGVQKHRMNVWAGLSTLQLLGLLTRADADELITYLADTDALALVVGAYELN